MNDLFPLDRLRELREAAGLTQSEMARLCGLRGQQSHQTASAWERGTMVPSAGRQRHPQPCAGAPSVAVGRLRCGAALCRPGLAIRQAVLGAQHPDSAVSHHLLGILGQETGEFAQAQAHLQAALALCLLEAGQDTAQARSLMQQALAIRRQQLGESHPYTATFYVNSGYLLHEIGEWNAAGFRPERACRAAHGPSAETPAG